MLELLLLPILAGVLVALVAGPLGSFTIWRGMAYFGDTLAHSALLGVATALIFDLNVQLGILICCLTIALLLLSLQKQSSMSADSILGILSHSALALGLVVVSLLPGNRVDLFAYLFGDLLTVTVSELWLIFVLVAVSLGSIVYLWRDLLMLAVDEELAQAEGHKVNILRLVLILLMALIVAVAMKTVGILLITALLIIPAAAAQRVTRSPEAMALCASLLGVFAVFGGLFFSAQFDTASGPSIVVCATATFVCTFLYARLRKK